MPKWRTSSLAADSTLLSGNITTKSVTPTSPFIMSGERGNPCLNRHVSNIAPGRPRPPTRKPQESRRSELCGKFGEGYAPWTTVDPVHECPPAEAILQYRAAKGDDGWIGCTKSRVVKFNNRADECDGSMNAIYRGTKTKIMLLLFNAIF